MKNLMTLLMLFTVFMVNGQVPHFRQDNDISDINGVIYLHNNPYTGVLFDPYPNDKRHIEANYKLGLRDGKYNEFYENGKKKMEGFYVNGNLEGKQSYWFENGKLKEEVNYSNNKPNGKHITWFENGQQQKEENFADGSLDGTQTYWYENGQKKKEEKYFLGNQLNRIEWHSNGVKQCEIAYSDGKIKDGDYIFTDEKGINYTVTYAQGYMTKKKFSDNRFENYYENGQKKDEGRLNDNGHVEGAFMAWWSNGNKRSEGTDIDGKLEGKFTVWYESGNLNSISNFKNGLHDGESIVYDENGGKMVSFYENGNLVKKESIKEENMVSKISQSGNELLFYCISGADNDTSFIKLNLENENSNDSYKNQIISAIMSYMNNRFHTIGNVEDEGFRHRYITYFYELSGVNYSTNNVSYKSKCVDKNFKIYDCVRNGYTASCQYHLTLMDASKNVLYNGNALFKSTDATYQGDVYSETANDAIYKISKKANSEYAVYHFFPIKAYISDLGKVRGQEKVKTVVISVGSDFGVYKGLEFNVHGDDSWSSNNVIAKLEVTEINANTALCKVVSGGEDIFKQFNSNQKVKIISNR